jgi:hypothetical protein
MVASVCNHRLPFGFIEVYDLDLVEKAFLAPFTNFLKPLLHVWVGGRVVSRRTEGHTRGRGTGSLAGTMKCTLHIGKQHNTLEFVFPAGRPVWRREKDQWGGGDEVDDVLLALLQDSVPQRIGAGADLLALHHFFIFAP